MRNKLLIALLVLKAMLTVVGSFFFVQYAKTALLSVSSPWDWAYEARAALWAFVGTWVVELLYDYVKKKESK